MAARRALFVPANITIQQGLYGNKEIKFQYLPGWIELNFQDISDLINTMAN